MVNGDIEVMFITNEMLIGAILGALIGSVFIPILQEIGKEIIKWYRRSLPANKLFGSLRSQDEICKIFIRDFITKENAEIFTVTPSLGIGQVSNINKFWADVDARAATDIFNVLGQTGKTRNIVIKFLSQDTIGEWDSNIFLIGAHTPKAADFFDIMKSVAYRIDTNNIIDMSTGNEIPRESGYGYGVILKTINPQKFNDENGISFFIGGFGTFRTVATAYYFRENYKRLGKEFGNNCFGIILKASLSAGIQSVQRIKKYDKVMM
jgi:hypothetical protein